MTTITVADRNGLLSAFNAAKGGDTIVLKDGYYGSIKVTADYASTVTVKAEGALDATIANLTVSGGTNVKFDGIKFDNGVNGNNGGRVVSIEGGSQNVAVVNSEVTGSVDGVYDGQWGIYVRDSNGVTLDNNKVHDVQTCIVVFGSSNSAVTNNSVDYFSEDGFKFGGFYNSTVSGNKSFGQVYATAGTHADFMQFQGDATNVRISDNLFLAKTDGWLQGIFASDGAYRNLTIENNLVSTGMLRGISVVDGSSGITVNNNTLLNVKGYHNATTILAPAGSSVNNNITSHYLAGPSGSNLALQNNNPGAAYYVDNYYKNGDAGLGMTLQDLAPVAGSAATTKGAISLIQSLLGGAGVPSTPSAPSTPTQPSTPGAGADAGTEASINAGGSADAYYSGGDTYSTGAGIAGTSADGIYQTERYGNFKYAVGLDNGTYDVTLKFAEIYLNGAGQRLFDVKAENQLILDNYDVYAAAGGKNAAVDRTFQVKVSDGKLDLDFISVKDNAKVSGIEITPSSGTTPAPTPAPGGGSHLAVNAGGGASGGFAADAFFFGGNTYSTGAGIAGTTADAIYQTERYGNFKYSAAVDNGTYGVTLKFAEIYLDGAGQRVFDVKAENKIVLDNYDVFDEAGGKNIAHDETFQVNVTDGKLDLDFISLVENAKVSGIEIDYLG